VIILVLAVAATVNASKINVQRYLTLGELQSDYNTSEFGRQGLWRRGLEVFVGRPLTGVGVQRFAQAVGDSRAEDKLLPKWQEAHNTYVQVLVELGLFGAIPLLLLIVTCFKNFSALGRLGGSSPGSDFDVFPVFLTIGFAAQLVTAFFLTQAYSMFFTLIFAVSASLKGIAEHEAPAPTPTAANAAAVPRSWGAR